LKSGTRTIIVRAEGYFRAGGPPLRRGFSFACWQRPGVYPI